MPTHSQHFFLFPFTITLPSKSKGAIDFFEQKLDSKKWKVERTKIDTVETYNQHVYFHDFAERAMFNHLNDKTQLTFYYQNLEGTNPTYNISVKGSGKVYQLDITDIQLQIYNTNIGVLSFHLENNQYAEPDDILTINDYGRRLYPQFLAYGQQINLHHPAQYNFLAQSIVLSNTTQELDYTEDFNYYDSFAPNRQMYIRLPEHIMGLIGRQVICDESSKDQYPSKALIKPTIDDRMFVVSLYCNESLTNKLCKLENDGYFYELAGNNANKWSELETTSNKTQEEEQEQKEYTYWPRYIFVDTGWSTLQHSRQMQQAIDKHTYNRWANYGSLYGICRYSFVALTSSRYYFDNIISKHFPLLYLPLVRLCLVQRASVLAFSERIHNISNIEGSHNLSEDKVKGISALYLDYIKFVNRIFFREITAQEQGIELYTMLQAHMNIEKEVSDLDGEMEELNQYAETYQSSRLTELATYFLPITMVCGILGLNIVEGNLNEGLFCWCDWPIYVLLLLLFIFSKPIVKLILWIFKKIERLFKP